MSPKTSILNGHGHRLCRCLLLTFRLHQRRQRLREYARWTTPHWVWSLYSSMYPTKCLLLFTTTANYWALCGRIEEPCLDHVHGDPTRPDEPSGHALTATAQILSISSSPPPKRCSLLPVQDLPASILDRMLALAPEVATDDGITPIQAWDILRRKSSLGNLTRSSLMILAENLRNSAKCHGYVFNFLGLSKIDTD